MQQPMLVEQPHKIIQMVTQFQHFIAELQRQQQQKVDLLV
jgi:hypothetical protein